MNFKNKREVRKFLLEAVLKEGFLEGKHDGKIAFNETYPKFRTVVAERYSKPEILSEIFESDNWAASACESRMHGNPVDVLLIELDQDHFPGPYASGIKANEEWADDIAELWAVVDSPRKGTHIMGAYRCKINEYIEYSQLEVKGTYSFGSDD